MTSLEIALIRRSFARAFMAKANIAKCFYADLFLRAPDLRRIFPREMGPQQDKLNDMIATLVRESHRGESLSGPLRNMAIRHVAYGARPEHFPFLRDALVHALRTQIPGGLVQAEVEAWIAGFDWVAGQMIPAMEAELAERRSAAIIGSDRVSDFSR